ncbi:unnamed protein product [Rhizophagus irregularis]|nr:unnamed protein product [Rhizophagus irregularis]CAB5382254.1 unnamed protein product [Rhizophagus irregularis]
MFSDVDKLNYERHSQIVYGIRQGIPAQTINDVKLTIRQIGFLFDFMNSLNLYTFQYKSYPMMLHSNMWSYFTRIPDNYNRDHIHGTIIIQEKYT